MRSINCQLLWWHFYAPEIEDCPDCHSVLLSFCPPFWNLNLANNFWTVSARALIFHMRSPFEKTFLWVPLLWTLWPWPWSLTHFLITLTLLITCELCALEVWYFTWLFLVRRSFRGYHYFWHCDLDLGVWPIFWKL